MSDQAGSKGNAEDLTKRLEASEKDIEAGRVGTYEEMASGWSPVSELMPKPTAMSNISAEAAPADGPARKCDKHGYYSTESCMKCGAEPEPPRGGTEPPELVDIIEVVIPRGKGEWVRDRIKECFGWDAYLQVTRPSSPIPALGVRELAKVLRDAWNTGDKGTWVNVAKAAIEALKPVGVLPSEWVSGAVELLDKALLGKIDAEWHDRAIVLLSETPERQDSEREGQ